MKKLNIFLDSSALIAGVISETGADHALLQLGETEDILLTISELVFNETTRSIAKKSADNLEDIQKEIKRAKIKIIKDPSHGEVQANLYWIDDPDNVPILLAAGKTKKTDLENSKSVFSAYKRERCSVMRSSITTVLCLVLRTSSVEATNPKITKRTPVNKINPNIMFLRLTAPCRLFNN